jgi:hypothetical protein
MCAGFTRCTLRLAAAATSGERVTSRVLRRNDVPWERH